MSVETMRLCRILERPITDDELLHGLAAVYKPRQVGITQCGLVCLVASQQEPYLVVHRNAEHPAKRSDHFLWVNPNEMAQVLRAFPNRIVPMSIERPVRHL